MCSTAFAFDRNDRFKKITDAAMQSSTYTYDSAGNLANAVQPGNTVSYTYDKNNRPVAVERLFGVDTRASEQITYDALGHIKTHMGTSAIPEYTFSRSYAYDALGQLASYGDGENTESYLYDTLGNRTEKQTDGKTAAAYQYNAMNQLTAMTQGEETYSYLYDRRGNLTEERLGEQVLKSYAYDAANRMISGTNLVSNAKSEYTYNGLLARVKKTSGAQASSYMPNYAGRIHNDLVTQIAGVGTVNAVYGQGYGRASQRFMPETGTEAADTYFQHDLYGSTLFAADAQGAIRHHAAHDIWGMPETACGDSSVASGLRFTTYDYDAVLGKHFAHARMYDPSQGRMLGADPVKRGLNGYAYCDNAPVNQTDPTGEVASILLGGIAGGIIGGAFGFAGSALSQIAAGNGFSARKAWGAAANGAIVGAARGALIGSGAGIPLAFGVDFAAGMAGSLAEQKIAGGRLSPVRAAVDGAFNAAGGRLYGTSPLRNAKDAFMRGALEGALKGGAYNIADVLDNKLRNAYGSGGRRNPGTRNPWNKKNQTPWNSRTPRPTGSRCPQSDCIRPKPLKGMRNPKRSSGANGNGNTTHRNDRFSLGSFVRDVVSGAVMGGLASVTFYGAGKAVEALKRGAHEVPVVKPEYDSYTPRLKVIRTFPNNKTFTRVVEFQASADGTGLKYRVYQRNDIDWDLVRTRGAKIGIGYTNLEAAVNFGCTPVLSDGYLTNLHHSQQKCIGPLFEVSTRYHYIANINRAPLHPYKRKKHPYFPMSPDIRNQFEGVDVLEYWMLRGKDELSRRVLNISYENK
ncbi:MAG: hypothetical protein K1W36_13815 [Lachnospiraceae bacterium]